MNKTYYSVYQTNIAPFYYSYAPENILLNCHWITDEKYINVFKGNAIEKKWIQFEDELDKYFSKQLKAFKINIKYDDLSVFSIKVLESLKTIPFGEVKTYKNISDAIKKPYSYRAIGQACKNNPFPLVIPCHRVISKKGYGGYMGEKEDSPEINIKKRVLEFEGVVL